MTARGFDTVNSFAEVFGLSAGAPAGLEAYLLIGAVLFVLGLVACMSRKNAIGILIGIELILNAAVLNILAFSRFQHAATDIPGQIFAVFVIVLAACEAAIALAVLLNLYFNVGSIEVDFVHELKE